MKLTRRKIILGFGSTLAIIGAENSFRKVRAQSPSAEKKLQHKSIKKIDFLANGDIDKEAIYNEFLKAANNGKEDKPALLYKGIETSPYQDEIKYYSSRLKEKPDGTKLVSGIQADNSFSPYPSIGKLPKIDDKGLDFIHKDIKEACICIGSFAQRDFKTKWLGRRALKTQEFWSGTKLIPLLNFVYLLNQKTPGTNLDFYNIRGLDKEGKEINIPFYNLARDIISYEENVATSNSLGAMFKRFIPQLKLEKWVKSITGNDDLVFRGRYGEKPFIDQPEVVHIRTKEILLNADKEPPEWACNEISAYDLTRMISMMGWHNYIPEESRLPGVKWRGIKTVIRAMGTDPARLTDLAIEILGLEKDIDSVVILSKLGNGSTGLRERTEAVYVALVQFIDRSPQESGKPGKLTTLSMALRGGIALEPRDFDREVIELDARMATEVTDLIWRAVNGKLA
ncbi:MAG: peptidoglycan-binding protein [Moorea sp. SIO2B7]|nr:peptidoglycan-binding protein [Moorena sp. SIO2B7]